MHVLWKYTHLKWPQFAQLAQQDRLPMARFCVAGVLAAGSLVKEEMIVSTRFLLSNNTWIYRSTQ